MIAVLTFAVYGNTLQVPLEFDDIHTIQENIRIRNPGNFLKWEILTSPRPLVDFTFALNYHFGRLNVQGYHVVNILIHIGNAILVFFLSQMIFRKLSPESGRHFLFPALVSALVFAVHPLQTQAVTYIAQRYTSMAALFYLLSILCYMRGRDFSGSMARGVLWWGGSVVAALAAFLCKQSAASLPLAILLVEYVCYDRTWRGWISKLTWMAPAIFLVALFYAYSMGVFRGDVSLGSLLEDVSEKARETRDIGRWQYLVTQFSVMVIYIRLLFLPIHQNLDYMVPFKTGFWDGTTPVAFLFLVGLVALAWWCRNKKPVLTLGIGWFFVALSVESSIFPIRDALFEHRVYLPMFGFCLIVGDVISQIPSVRKTWLYSSVALVIGVLAILTVQRNQLWRDSVSLWSDSVARNPANYRALTNLGYALKQKGDLEGAAAMYDRALALRPTYFFALSNKGVLMGMAGRLDEAASLFQKALRYQPEYTPALNNLGYAKFLMGKTEEAIDCYRQAIRKQRNFPDAHTNLGDALASQGKYEESVRHYEEVLRVDPQSAAPWVKAADVRYMMHHFEKSATYYRQALRFEPKNAEIHLKTGNSLMEAGLNEEAVTAFREAIQLKPGLVEAYMNLGAVLARSGKAAEAVEPFRTAVKLAPHSAEAHANLGAVLSSQGNTKEAMEHLTMALRLNPESENIRQNIRLIIRKQMAGKAEEMEKEKQAVPKP
jgi:tetratricopeptide (TPR) repeat protein